MRKTKNDLAERTRGGFTLYLPSARALVSLRASGRRSHACLVVSAAPSAWAQIPHSQGEQGGRRNIRSKQGRSKDSLRDSRSGPAARAHLRLRRVEPWMGRTLS